MQRRQPKKKKRTLLPHSITYRSYINGTTRKKSIKVRRQELFDLKPTARNGQMIVICVKQAALLTENKTPFIRTKNRKTIDESDIF
jgi:hypothetical protein